LKLPDERSKDLPFAGQYLLAYGTNGDIARRAVTIGTTFLFSRQTAV